MSKNKFLFYWVVLQLGIFLLGFFLQRNNEDLSLLNKLQYSVYISRGAGLCLAVTPMLLLFPLCRRTVSLLRKIIPFMDNFFPDFSLFFHKVCAYTTVFWSLVHMSFHYVNFYGVEKILNLTSMFNLHYTIFAGISGHLMMISLFSVVIFSGLFFRRYHYELFWYSHHLFILFFIAYPFHSVGCFVKTDKGKCMPYYSGIIFAPILVIYIIERLIRESQPYVKVKDVTFHEDVVKIKIAKTRNYKAGQYFLVKCMDISKSQWHPFTISSSPYEDDIEFTIRCLGDWTTKFRNHLLYTKDNLPYIKVDGPFGSPIDTICKYDTSILIASGIGITPYISVLKYMIEKTKYKPFVIKKIDVIWVNNDIKNFEWFNKELDYINKNSLNLKITFHVHLTEKINNVNKTRLICDENLSYLNYVYKTNIPIKYGRPNFKKFFSTYLKENTDYKVGCFVCSSRAIEVDVKNACKIYSNKDVNFIFKTEKFT